MELFKSTVSMAAINFRRWLRDIRVWFILLATFLIIKDHLTAVVTCGLAEQERASICMLPLLFHPSGISVGAPKIILHMGMMGLLCDSPFFQPMTPYMILRSRRNGWWSGACLYIFGAALAYMLFITLVSSAMMLPIATFANDWGNAVGYFIYGDKSRTATEFMMLYGSAPVPTYTVMYVYPYAAQLYTFLTGWCSFSFVGLVMYAVSLYQKSWIWSISAASIFIFLEPVLKAFSAGRTYWLQLFSLLCWTSIDYLNIFEPAYRLSIPIVASLSIFVIAVMFVIIWRRSLVTVIELRES